MVMLDMTSYDFGNGKRRSVPIEPCQSHHGYDEPFLFARIYTIRYFDFTFYR